MAARSTLDIVDATIRLISMASSQVAANIEKEIHLRAGRCIADVGHRPGDRLGLIIEQCKSSGRYQLEWQKENGCLTGSVRADRHD